MRGELDQLRVAELSALSFSTVKHIRPEHRHHFGKYFTHVIKLFVQAHCRIRVRGTVVSYQAEGSSQGWGFPPADRTRLEKTIKLLYVTQALLQSADRRLPRQQRYKLFAVGEIYRMLTWFISFAKQGAIHTGYVHAASIRARAEYLAHQRGEITKPVSLLISSTAPSTNDVTLEFVREKHLDESAPNIAAARCEAAARLARPPTGISRIQAVEESFPTDLVTTNIHRGNPQNSACPSGLRFSHLQQVFSPYLDEAISIFSRLVLEAKG